MFFFHFSSASEQCVVKGKGKMFGRLQTYLTLDRCSWNPNRLAPYFCDRAMCPLRGNGDYRAKARALRGRSGRRRVFLLFFFIHIIYSQATEQSKRKWLKCSRRVDVARMISSYTESPSPSLAQSQPFTQSSIVSFTSCNAAVAVYTVMH